MQPFYEDEAVTLYCGDAAVVLPTLAPVELLLTDPPYGIGEAAGKNRKRGGRAFGKPGTFVPAKDYGSSDWDNAVPARWLLDMARSKATSAVIFGGNYFDLPPSRCWLVWDKDNTGDFADCELAWTNLDRAVRRLTYRWNGMLQEPGYPKELRQHPTQKPEAVMLWALGLVPDARTILDPFAGSGTTLVAAKRLGRKAIGIELSPAYCDVIVSRLRQGSLLGQGVA
jgi:DNA modification methylase